MKEFIEVLKAAIMAESYEDRAGRSVISVKSALEVIDRLAAEQPAAPDLEKLVENIRWGCYAMGLDESQTEIIVAEIKGAPAAEQSERESNTDGVPV